VSKFSKLPFFGEKEKRKKKSKNIGVGQDSTEFAKISTPKSLNFYIYI
jgi:hypothetical protein